MTPEGPIKKDMYRITPNMLNLHEGILQYMSVVRIPLERHGTHKPVASTGRYHTDLATELVTLVCLPPADAFYRWRGH